VRSHAHYNPSDIVSQDEWESIRQDEFELAGLDFRIQYIDSGGMNLDQKFFLESDALRTHQVRLEGGDASSDSYCYA
jgi:selenium-binding protein 1